MEDLNKILEGNLPSLFATKLWDLIVKDLTQYLLSDIKLSQVQVQVLISLIDNLSPYFYLQGKGIDKQFLDRSTR